MIKEKYLEQISQIIKNYKSDKNFKVFLFGSSLEKEKFGDVDLGIMGNVSDHDLSELRDYLFDSTLPYNVDLINFNKVSEKFKNNILSSKILWIRL